VDPKASRLPAYIEGRIEGLPESANRSKLAVAVAVNGVIRGTAVTTNTAISSLTPQNATIDEDARGVYFLVRLPPAGFVEGVNRVTVHAIVEGVEGNAVSLFELEER
jgi:hypothetical protein